MLYSAPGVYRECTFRSEQIASQPMLLLISLNIGLTEVVPTVGGERELMYNRYTVTTHNGVRMGMGSDVSRFNVSLIVQGNVTRHMSINRNV